MCRLLLGMFLLSLGTGNTLNETTTNVTQTSKEDNDLETSPEAPSILKLDTSVSTQATATSDDSKNDTTDSFYAAVKGGNRTDNDTDSSESKAASTDMSERQNKENENKSDDNDNSSKSEDQDKSKKDDQRPITVRLLFLAEVSRPKANEEPSSKSTITEIKPLVSIDLKKSSENDENSQSTSKHESYFPAPYDKEPDLTEYLRPPPDIVTDDWPTIRYEPIIETVAENASSANEIEVKDSLKMPPSLPLVNSSNKRSVSILQEPFNPIKAMLSRLSSNSNQSRQLLQPGAARPETSLGVSARGNGLNQAAQSTQLRSLRRMLALKPNQENRTTSQSIQANTGVPDQRYTLIPTPTSDTPNNFSSPEIPPYSTKISGGKLSLAERFRAHIMSTLGTNETDTPSSESINQQSQNPGGNERHNQEHHLESTPSQNINLQQQAYLSSNDRNHQQYHSGPSPSLQDVKRKQSRYPEIRSPANQDGSPSRQQDAVYDNGFDHRRGASEPQSSLIKSVSPVPLPPRSQLSIGTRNPFFNASPKINFGTHNNSTPYSGMEYIRRAYGNNRNSEGSASNSSKSSYGNSYFHFLDSTYQDTTLDRSIHSQSVQSGRESVSTHIGRAYQLQNSNTAGTGRYPTVSRTGEPGGTSSNVRPQSDIPLEPTNGHTGESPSRVQVESHSTSYSGQSSGVGHPTLGAKVNYNQDHVTTGSQTSLEGGRYQSEHGSNIHATQIHRESSPPLGTSPVYNQRSDRGQPSGASASSYNPRVDTRTEGTTFIGRPGYSEGSGAVHASTVENPRNVQVSDTSHSHVETYGNRYHQSHDTTHTGRQGYPQGHNPSRGSNIDRPVYIYGHSRSQGSIHSSNLNRPGYTHEQDTAGTSHADIPSATHTSTRHRPRYAQHDARHSSNTDSSVYAHDGVGTSHANAHSYSQGHVATRTSNEAGPGRENQERQAYYSQVRKTSYQPVHMQRIRTSNIPNQSLSIPSENVYTPTGSVQRMPTASDNTYMEQVRLTSRVRQYNTHSNDEPGFRQEIRTRNQAPVPSQGSLVVFRQRVRQTPTSRSHHNTPGHNEAIYRHQVRHNPEYSHNHAATPRQQYSHSHVATSVNNQYHTSRTQQSSGATIASSQVLMSNRQPELSYRSNYARETLRTNVETMPNSNTNPRNTNPRDITASLANSRMTESRGHHPINNDHVQIPVSNRRASDVYVSDRSSHGNTRLSYNASHFASYNPAQIDGPPSVPQNISLLEIISRIVEATFVPANDSSTTAHRNSSPNTGTTHQQPELSPANMWNQRGEPSSQFLQYITSHPEYRSLLSDIEAATRSLFTSPHQQTNQHNTPPSTHAPKPNDHSLLRSQNPAKRDSPLTERTNSSNVSNQTSEISPKTNLTAIREQVLRNIRRALAVNASSSRQNITIDDLIVKAVDSIMRMEALRSFECHPFSYIYNVNFLDFIPIRCKTCPPLLKCLNVGNIGFCCPLYVTEQMVQIRMVTSSADGLS